MERSSTAPVQKPHNSTADLLAWWPEKPSSSPIYYSAPASRPSNRAHQEPSGRINQVVFGGQMTVEEADSLLNRKPYGFKLRDITGSGIFAVDGENGAPGYGIAISTPDNKTGLRIFQPSVSARSQISFMAEESVSPKKPTSVAEIAKQRELSGTIDSEADANMKHLSDAKSKELGGHDIFGPPESPQRPLAARPLGLKESSDMEEPAPRNIRTSVKVSNPAGGHSNIMFSEETEVRTGNSIPNPKFAELTGNGIFKRYAPPRLAEKPLRMTKLQEMRGSNIFADGTAVSADYLRGVRKPPGGESSIMLV